MIYNLYEGRTIIFFDGGGGWGLENFENKLYSSKKQFLQKNVDTKKLFAAGAAFKKKCLQVKIFQLLPPPSVSHTKPGS